MNDEKSSTATTMRMLQQQRAIKKEQHKSLKQATWTQNRHNGLVKALGETLEKEGLL